MVGAAAAGVVCGAAWAVVASGVSAGGVPGTGVVTIGAGGERVG